MAENDGARGLEEEKGSPMSRVLQEELAGMVRYEGMGNMYTVIS